MISKGILLLNTVKHLKAKQLFYQVLYRLKRASSLSNYNHQFNGNVINWLSFKKSPEIPTFYDHTKQSFKFLNLEKQFDENVDWGFDEHGKLWNYNLQYFNYLEQEDISIDLKINWIKDLYNWLSSGRLPLEPYPASLRIINTIRFVSRYDIKDELILGPLHAEADYLSRRLEFHILGNHLLENYFSLMMAGAFFSDKKWLKIAEEGLTKELNEQTLPDGANFELSPMYHKIILFRVLELIDWYGLCPLKNNLFEDYLKGVASKMVSWLENICFSTGEIPHFNDSADGIALSTNWLISYSGSLAITPAPLSLTDSGYRSFQFGDYECKVDVGPIGAPYQPGHAHADALSFQLYYQGIPFFTEVGTSTYNIGERRNLERSTKAHSTVVVNDKNQSEIWGGFRVGRRAAVHISNESKNSISAYHTGYNNMGVTHYRKFEFKENRIHLEDQVVGKNINSCIAYFYIDNQWIERSGANWKQMIKFDGANRIVEEEYLQSIGFNKYAPSTYLKVYFSETLRTTIF